MNEFTFAYEDGKIMGVLEHMGGVSEFFDEIIEICRKKSKARMVYDSDPKNLIKAMLEIVKKRKIRKNRFKE